MALRWSRVWPEGDVSETASLMETRVEEGAERSTSRSLRNSMMTDWKSRDDEVGTTAPALRRPWRALCTTSSLSSNIAPFARPFMGDIPLDVSEASLPP